MLESVGKVGGEKVLAEPFPWTVSQGVILVFVIVNSRLYKTKMDLPTQTTQLEP